MKAHNGISNQIVFYLFLFFSINFLGEGSCMPDGMVEYDPLQGTLMDAGGKYVTQAKVVGTSSVYQHRATGPVDSAQTWDNGSFTLGNGIPNHFVAKSGGCVSDHNKTYDKMETFYLVCTHPSYDTTIAVFIDGRSYSMYGVDTVFSGPSTEYGQNGALRHIPTIIMKSKNR
ncbi:MAG: hypothetical protein EHM64_14275 [Ignavibacteriae bacterium]|nr:MAG: hypothetical protein EHM64_14275 [Ignavibacteriota bacterium]